MDVELRDRFAMTALQSLLAIGGSFFESGMVLADNIAQNAFKIADAMMRARTKPAAPSRAMGYRKSIKPKASKDIFAKILEMHVQGIPNRDIARHFGINGQSVNGVVACSRRSDRNKRVTPKVRPNGSS